MRPHSATYWLIKKKKKEKEWRYISSQSRDSTKNVNVAFGTTRCSVKIYIRAFKNKIFWRYIYSNRVQLRSRKHSFTEKCLHRKITYKLFVLDVDFARVSLDDTKSFNVIFIFLVIAGRVWSLSVKAGKKCPVVQIFLLIKQHVRRVFLKLAVVTFLQ